MFYEKKDIRVKSGVKNTYDNRIPYVIRTKDRNVEGNFFWEKGDVEMRILDFRTSKVTGRAFPFAYGGVLPTKEKVSDIFLNILKKENIRRR